jgi:hypothetical protein
MLEASDTADMLHSGDLKDNGGDVENTMSQPIDSRQ